MGSIVITYLTKVYQRRAEKKRQPKNRIETIFDGYDALIAQLREDQNNQAQLISNLQKLVESQAQQLQTQAQQLDQSQGMIAKLKAQLDESAIQISRLQAQLQGLRSVSESTAQ